MNSDAWRTSSHSQGASNCVAARSWRKPRRSFANGNCVAVTADVRHPQVGVRDTKDPHGPQLAFTPAAWKSFTAALKRT